MNNFDRYGRTRNAYLNLVGFADDYMPAVEDVLSRIRRAELVLYNAGMDAYQHCTRGGIPGIDDTMLRERERLVFADLRAKGIPVAFVLAGGYIDLNLSREKLVELHRCTITEAARH